MNIRYIKLSLTEKFQQDARLSRLKIRKLKLASIVKRLKKELMAFKPSDVVIALPFTDECFRNGGVSIPKFPCPVNFAAVGVAVVSKNGKIYAFRGERFLTWQSNLLSIAMLLQRLREIASLTSIPQSMVYEPYRFHQTQQQNHHSQSKPREPDQNYSADPFSAALDAAQVLAKHSTSTVTKIMNDLASAKSAYREASKKTHPDAGGSSELFKEVFDAWNEMQKHFKVEVTA